MQPRNLKLTLVYEGTAYAGFQRQENGLTIQAVLEDCLRRLTGEEDLRVAGAGRTDAGVHALGQVASFCTSAKLPAARFAPALNSLLPRDIAVRAAEEVPPGFHARFDARSKTYAYRLWRPAARPVFERGRSYHFPRTLDRAAMKDATMLLCGEHDFACFCSAGAAIRTTTRTIHRAAWADEGDLLVFTVTADGFLYRMVRNTVGTLLQVGLGKRPAEWIGALLAGRDRRAAGPSVPAAGLFLVSVEY